MAHNEQHDHLIKELSEILDPVFQKSPQAVYLYLDDEHKICNQKFADMVGYSSIEEWVKNQTPVSDVSEEDQERVIKAYGEASENLKASQLSVNINTKDGKTIHVNVIMVPITFKDEVFVLHFISEI